MSEISEELLKRHRMQVSSVADSPYTYRLSKLGSSSARYGPCEICGKFVSDTWIQTEGQVFVNPETQNTAGITYYKCTQFFGHRECLESKQR